MNDYFDNYDEKHSELVIKILDYFNIMNSNNVSIKDKSIMGFCEQYPIKQKRGHTYKYDPIIVTRICRRLCECGQMTRIKNDEGLGFGNNYIFVVNREDLFESNKIV